MKKALAVLLLLAGIAGGPGATEIFVREDGNGGRRYSDRPFANAKKLSIQPGVSYRIVRTVFDGDTILLDDKSRVRLAGINTPEVESSRKSEEPGGEEAKIWLKRAIQGKKVRLESDVERSDRYRRMLAHVFTEDGTHINRLLVRGGLATVTIHPPNLKYVPQLLADERYAETRKLGLWRDPAYAPVTVAELPRLKGRGWRRIRGQAFKLKRNRKFHRLIYSEQFDVRIPRGNLDWFPDLNTYLRRASEIRGWPSRRKDHYSILVLHPSALRLLENR
ncbi:MAG: thermonuclease family protein [Gammaproteobacteria bacterium]